MDPQLTVRVIWQDEDMVEVDVHVSNQVFAGRTQVYTTYDELSRLAQELLGFPRSSSHAVAFETGKRDSYSFFGGRFYCFDKAGHAALHVTIESNVPTEYRAEQKNKVQLEIQFEPLQIDRFVTQLVALVKAKSGQATLVGIPPYTQNVEANAV